MLRGVDLAIRIPARRFTILGGSGSGKSVCLKHMIGLLKADRGQCVRVGATTSPRLRSGRWSARAEERLDDLPERRLFDSLSVSENIAYPLREHRDWDEERIAGTGSRVPRRPWASTAVEQIMPAELSGGMRKRVGVARGIALEPAAILYDEPTTGLDPANQRRIGELIRVASAAPRT